jgi:phosphate transport system substrate-binding protein
VNALGIAQVRAIFTGKITDWSALGSGHGTIRIYARDAQSGTFDTFRHLVLGGGDLLHGIERFADSAQLSDRVASDPAAIGFIGFPYIRQARALAISEEGGRALLPSQFTVADESYPLSRRLYLYTLPAARTPLAAELINFVLSPEGQRVARENGFIDLSIAARIPEACDSRCPPDYAAATRGARRLTLDFRFRPGSGELDSRAIRDLERLVAWLSESPASQLLLLGFADDRKLSLDEARAVAAQLERRGVRARLVEGFGAAMPLSSDPEARQRNRRVEVWIRGA